MGMDAVKLPVRFVHVPTQSGRRLLHCPDCGLGLNAYRCERTVIFKCIKCHGLWFDEKRLGAFQRALAEFDFTSVQISVTPPADGAYCISSCPRCKQVLQEVRYGYNTDVRVYRCFRGCGAWLQLVHLVQLIGVLRTSQLIAEDVRGFLRELGEMERELKFYWRIGQIARLLSSPFY